MSQLHMHLPSLADLPPAPPLPDGYELRRATTEDAEGVAALMVRAFADPWDAEKARAVLLENADVWATFVVEHGGVIVASASCMELRDRPATGYVHWVGADPGHGGRKLGLIINLAVLEEFVRRGKTDAILNTDDHRLPALRTYLRLGFVPSYRDEAHEARWSGVFRALL